MARAATSLPVPVSPWISTVASERATRARRANSSRMGMLAPTIGPKRASGQISTGVGSGA
jgi:hypothetical protein